MCVTTLRVAFLHSCILGFIATASALFAEDDFSLSAESAVALNPGGYAKIDVDLGELEQNKRGVVYISVTNRTGSPVSFGPFSSTCKCVDAHFDISEIPDGGIATLSVHLKTPNQPKAVDQIVAFSFGDSKGKGAVRVQLRYRIQKLIAFRDKMASVNCLEGDKEVKILLPLAISEPTLKSNDVEVVPAVCFERFKWKFVTEDDRPYLEAKLEVDSVNVQALAGEIRLVNKQTQLEDTVLLTVVKNPRLQVIPQILRIKEISTDDEELTFEGRLLLRVFPREIAKRSAKLIDNKIRVQANLANAKVTSEVRDLANETAQVVFRILPNTDSFDPHKDTEGILLDVTYNGEKFRSHAKVRVESSFSIKEVKR